MSDLIWIANILPDFFWSLLVFLSIIAIAISYMPLADKIPKIKQYVKAIRVIGVIALLVGVYFHGVVANENKWKERVKDLEQKVVKLESESKTTNQQLSETIAEKNRLAEQKGKEVVKEIVKWKNRDVLKLVPVAGPERVRVEEVIKIIESCPVPKELVDIHNMGAAKPDQGAAK